ncbi:MAG TPA: type II toxin-antitoxin system mRNA interferase toxin, RelE/StbE family [Vicinamibacteria bacterium]|nr:type II toxin-antitoxin system mRNA interferase toxin, RelE/StbE family [Vicinamibacteria bacterium]
MWEVLEHRRAARRLDRLPKEVLKRYEKWKDIVRVSGPSGLRLIRGFHDEALRGEWARHRSSRLNQQYRVIYAVDAERVEILVVDVTPHDYRRKG